MMIVSWCMFECLWGLLGCTVHVEKHHLSLDPLSYTLPHMTITPASVPYKIPSYTDTHVSSVLFDTDIRLRLDAL